MDLKTFKTLARRALRGLPEEFQPFLRECALTIKSRPSKKILAELELPEDEDLLALYEGPSLLERSRGDFPEMPPRITLFYQVFLDGCETEEELIEEIQRTIAHEVGHHFGLDEDRLEELGFG